MQPAPASPAEIADMLDIEWRAEVEPVAYPDAVRTMEARAAAIAAGEARELIWLVEHPPLYTAGTSADPSELLDPRFPVYKTGRGGRYTYHGPGQRIGYLMLDLNRRGRDVRAFVHGLEQWLIDTLAEFDIPARAEPGRVGIWTGSGAQEAKIGAIGIRVRRWVTLHGFAINLSPDLTHFGGIVPCGLPDFAVTSACKLGKKISPETFDATLALNLATFLASLSTAFENDT
ncbi:lipoyl(octanoyl) transferase [Stakelama sediminis]|uniref:Octanoyltransferase n=1 Tax=Stakelama sediminis TaxID=463200 RepID=A0A840Z1Q0_9SPHN|nr:lipoyl(octanoyl) transferase LipB [Stakelama sediminis]MBB5720061.1 lipoyl(octanoyl) transferase [Stakelama sediminis]